MEEEKASEVVELEEPEAAPVEEMKRAAPVVLSFSTAEMNGGGENVPPQMASPSPAGGGSKAIHQEKAKMGRAAAGRMSKRPLAWTADGGVSAAEEAMAVEEEAKAKAAEIEAKRARREAGRAKPVAWVV